MTHHTDAERAEFEAWARDDFYAGLASLGDTWNSDRGIYSDAAHHMAFHAWQAARRAPAAPVPQGVLEAAQRAHDWMDSQADSQSKGNFHSFDLLCLRQERDALAEALAAAPQPPENQTTFQTEVGAAPQQPDGLMRENPATKPEEAPVQMPEPVAWRDPQNILPSQGCTYAKSTAEKWSHIYTEALYTEQQVRELLAANGIGKDGE